MRSFPRFIATSFLALSFIACDPGPGASVDDADAPADFVLTDAKVYTVNPDQPWAEAIAVSADRIVFVGSNEEAARFIGEGTKVGNLEGRMVMPGLIDCHLHVMLGAVAKSGVWLAECRTLEDVQEAVKAYAEENPDLEVIFGWGYPETFLDPKKEDLDTVVSDRAVYIVRSDGHSAWANSKALEVANIDRNTPDPAPPAGTLGRTESGDPTGAINGGPANLWMVNQLPDFLSTEQLQASAEPIINHITELGITSIFDAGAPMATESAFGFIVDLDRAGDLPIRYSASYYINSAFQAEGAVAELERLNAEFRSDRFRVNTLKITTDGVMENRKAALLEPYSDGSGVGAMNFTAETIKSLTLEAAEKGYDLYLHTLGDRAVRIGLDAAEALRGAGHDQTNFTLSHVQLANEADIPRFAAHDVILNSTGEWMQLYPGEEVHLGKRVMEQYPYSQLMADGVLFASGSDFPAHPYVNPFRHMEILTSRRPLGASLRVEPLNEDEVMTVEQAVESYTINGAKLLKLDSEIGTLEVGKLADLIVTDQNIFEIEKRAIHQTKVLLTMMDGKVWHDFLFEWGDSVDDPEIEPMGVRWDGESHLKRKVTY